MCACVPDRCARTHPHPHPHTRVHTVYSVRTARTDVHVCVFARTRTARAHTFLTLQRGCLPVYANLLTLCSQAVQPTTCSVEPRISTHIHTHVSTHTHIYINIVDLQTTESTPQSVIAKRRWRRLRATRFLLSSRRRLKLRLSIFLVCVCACACVRVRVCAGVQVCAVFAHVCACLHMCSHVYMRKREENKPDGESEKEGVGWNVLAVDAAACLRCLLVCVCVCMTRTGAVTSNQETISCVRTHPR